MIASLLALSMFAALAQAPYTTGTAETAPPPPLSTAPNQTEDANGDDPAQDAEEAAREAAAAVAEAAADAADEEDEATDEVCRRRQVQDQFGRMRSRKVCTPRE